MSEPELLDAATLQAFRDSLGADAAEIAATVFRLFLADAPKMVAALRQGWQENNLPIVLRSAHTLRSNCDTFGAHGLAKLCRELETSCRHGDHSRWGQQIPAIEDLFPRVLLAVQDELNRTISETRID
jgi:HPt (histidine-containing phosphotransfer) domain-containing protein